MAGTENGGGSQVRSTAEIRENIATWRAAAKPAAATARAMAATVHQPAIAALVSHGVSAIEAESIATELRADLREFGAALDAMSQAAASVLDDLDQMIQLRVAAEARTESSVGFRVAS